MPAHAGNTGRINFSLDDNHPTQKQMHAYVSYRLCKDQRVDELSQSPDPGIADKCDTRGTNKKRGSLHAFYRIGSPAPDILSRLSP